MNDLVNQNDTNNQMPSAAVAKLIDRVMSLTEEECSMVLAYLKKGEFDVL